MAVWVHALCWISSSFFLPRTSDAKQLCEFKLKVVFYQKIFSVLHKRQGKTFKKAKKRKHINLI